MLRWTICLILWLSACTQAPEKIGGKQSRVDSPIVVKQSAEAVEENNTEVPSLFLSACEKQSCEQETCTSQIKALSEIYGTSSCEMIDRELAQTTDLDLSSQSLASISLLADQTQLVKLNLNNNAIIDLAPLSLLKNLK